MIYTCCTEIRKDTILGTSGVALNGIDYLELLEPSSAATAAAPPSLLLHCLKAAPTGLTPDNFLLLGGESITGLTIASISIGADPTVLILQPSAAGDFSTYTLRLVNSAIQASGSPFDLTNVLTGFDPQLAEVAFSFKIDCGPDFDCAQSAPACAPASPTPPPINYLAKDYGSFRTVLLDRLSQLLPSWQASSEADLGVVLAELIAYRCDSLSYQQDAIATEAYLETARSRISLRRHALLVDYRVHDGCNARAWVQIEVAGNPGDSIFLDRSLTSFYTDTPGMPSSLAGPANQQAALLAGVQVFEPMQDAVLYPEHNSMTFYTWGETLCCLARGAVEATLYGSFPNLQPGDVLLFEEVLGPQTGNAADADLRHRAAVRLTQVATHDAYGNLLVDPLLEDKTGLPITDLTKQTPTPITEIQWSQEDALPFSVCLSSTYIDPLGATAIATNVSIVRGNVVLADHGLSLANIPLGTVPQSQLSYPPTASQCESSEPVPLPVRFRPTLDSSPLTQAVPLPLAGSPVTPNVVPLGGTGSVSLVDANNVTCLLIQANSPLQWPQFFGVVTSLNPGIPTNIDLAVLYNPPGGPSGMEGAIVLEWFPNLSLKTSDSNFIATQINRFSQLISVPSDYTPPKAAPKKLPTAPTMLTNTGAITLLDAGDPAAAYLTLEATSPTQWLQSFGVVAQGNQADPALFNLSVVYNPPEGGIGVSTPVTLEHFFQLSLATIPVQFQSLSELITVQSFAQSPNPSLSATGLMSFDPAAALPQISLLSTFESQQQTWTPQLDLLGSSETDCVFTVEVESDGTASLRFATPGAPDAPANGTNGKVPDSNTSFVASFRIGNGAAGNVGANSLVQFTAADARIQSCTNPLPAIGGTDPETNEQIRRRAPQAFLNPERSITPTDYKSVVEASPQVDQAVASLRWTGSWYTVFLAVEPRGGGALSPALKQTLSASVDQFRLAGQDFELESPQYVSLQITLNITVDPRYFQGNVEQSLLDVLSDRILPNGRKGLFFQDNFTFGQTVYLSPVYAAARSVPGVLKVIATQFQPQGVDSTRYLAAGEIKLGSLQVARLENDPSYPDHGQLTLNLVGGK